MLIRSMRRTHARTVTNRGASLLEVLVAILILSFGMLSMAGLHAVAFKYGKMAQFRGVATQLASDLADRMRANVAGATAGGYAYTQAYDPNPTQITPRQCGNPAPCSAGEMATLDLDQVRATLQMALPGGGLFVQQDAAQANVYDIWILWLDPEAHGNDANSTAASLTRCPDDIDATPMPQCMPMRVAL